MVNDADLVAAYARLTVQVGVNVQPGQLFLIDAPVEHAPFVRQVAAEAYATGAAFVDVNYADELVRRSHVEHAPDDRLGWSPPWLLERTRTVGRERGAVLIVRGDPRPDVFADLDGTRVAHARMRELGAAKLELTDGLCNWSIVAFPTEGWATKVFGEPDVARLWDAVVTATRLDEPDPVAAWRAHIAELDRRAVALSRHRFDAIRFRGPGTDLTVGLHADGSWQAAQDESNGVEHVANMPTEEVFTTPDARRTEGVVRSTYPLQIQGTVVRGLEIRFEGGRAVELHAHEGEALMRTHIAVDDGAARLGEVALVDRSSRVGKTGLVFYETLFDENAAAHVALGAASPQCVDGARVLSPAERHARGVNQSSIHIDLMIGSREVDVAGITASGEHVPILQRGDWVLR